MKKISSKKLRLDSDTLRVMSGADLRNAVGGMRRISAPTDEMGECSSCVSCWNCSLESCPPPPPF